MAMALTDDCVIVTGAAGNLGSVVAQMLASRGAQVVCVDRSERAFDVAGIDPARVMWISGADLSEKSAMDQVVAGAVWPRDRAGQYCRRLCHRAGDG